MIPSSPTPKRLVARLSAALLAGIVVNAIVSLLLFGPSIKIGQGPLIPAINAIGGWLRERVGEIATFHGLVLSLALPGLAAALAVNGWLRRGGVEHDCETRCRRCQYILRGISQPRCPECGEQI